MPIPGRDPAPITIAPWTLVQEFERDAEEHGWWHWATCDGDEKLIHFDHKHQMTHTDFQMWLDLGMPVRLPTQPPIAGYFTRAELVEAYAQHKQERDAA